MAAAKFIGVSGGAGKPLVCTFSQDGAELKDINSKTPFSQQKLKMTGTEGGKVEVANTGSSALFIKLQMDGIPATGDQTGSESNLEMKVRYTDLNFITIDPSVLEQGTDLIAEVTVSHPGIRDHYREMALTQVFPSGWEIRNLRMDEGQSTRMADKPEYQDIRDDRVHSYFDLNRSGSKTFRILLNATYLGDFYLPTVACEAMYDNEISAYKAGKWV